jgi:hypothetical protein
MRWRHVFAIAVLGASCSLRDVNRYSAGSEPLDTDAGCKAGGVSCIASSECCSGACEGTCAQCREIGSDCNPNAAVSGCCAGLDCVPDDSNVYSCQPVAACLNPADQGVLASNPDMSDVLRGCASDCAGSSTSSPAKCTACIASSAGLTSLCANCYKSWWFCLAFACPDDCQASSEACNACCMGACFESLFGECSGIESCPKFSLGDAG